MKKIKNNNSTNLYNPECEKSISFMTSSPSIETFTPSSFSSFDGETSWPDGNIHDMTVGGDACSIFVWNLNLM